MHIPNEIKIDTHLLEYNPGVYGDFVCGIVAYSVDGFFDPCNRDYTDNEKYWYSNNSSILRNQYPMSCRGNGYEHVERYTEFMLAHKMFLDYPALLDDGTISRFESMIFNTHSGLPYNNESHNISTELCRTITNGFTKTRTKFLTIDTSFDSIFMSACNEYYTSNGNEREAVNFKNLFSKFTNRIKTSRWVEKHLTNEQKLYIGDINNFNSDCISYYGNVNQGKFDEYLKEYEEQKLKILRKLTDRTLKQLKSNSDAYSKFVEEFEKEYDDFFDE